jgi:hypothetical protein
MSDANGMNPPIVLVDDVIRKIAHSVLSDVVVVDEGRQRTMRGSAGFIRA